MEYLSNADYEEFKSLVNDHKEDLKQLISRGTEKEKNDIVDDYASTAELTAEMRQTVVDIIHDPNKENKIVCLKKDFENFYKNFVLKNQAVTSILAAKHLSNPKTKK